MTDDDIVHDAFIIAWDVLERAGELRDLEKSAKLMRYQLMSRVAAGEKRRLRLVDNVLITYRSCYDLKMAS